MEPNGNTGAASHHFGVITWDHLISSDISSNGISSPSWGLTDNRPRCEAATQTTSFVCTPLFSGRRPRAACGLPDKASPKKLLRHIFRSRLARDGTLIYVEGHVGKKDELIMNTWL